MVVSKAEFNNALNQINVSFDKAIQRIKALEEKVAEIEESSKPTRKTRSTKDAE